MLRLTPLLPTSTASLRLQDLAFRRQPGLEADDFVPTPARSRPILTQPVIFYPFLNSWVTRYDARSEAEAPLMRRPGNFWVAVRRCILSGAKLRERRVWSQI